MAPGIADYYDKNTKKFLNLKRDKRIGAIHRRLYPPGVRDLERAFHHANDLILQALIDTRPSRILDIGCGIGGSIRYLSKHFDAEYVGITISPYQVQAAASMGVNLELADYLDSTWFSRQPAVDVMYAIESMQHNPDHRRLASNLRSLCREGSTLIVIDDFLTEGTDINHPLVKRFHRHWRVPGVRQVSELVAAYAGEGFVLEQNADLSPLMARRGFVRRLGNAASAILNTLGASGGYLDNIIGGNALLNLQHRGMAEYRMLEFRWKPH